MSGYVLVVDDDLLMRELLELALSGEGYEVESAPSVTDALASCQRRPPGVILFDLTLGQEDGESFVRAYRTLPNAHAALIAVSGASGLEQRVSALGITTFLMKPWDLDELLQAVKQATQAM
jgi:DNA-binding response OmpR family regulator